MQHNFSYFLEYPTILNIIPDEQFYIKKSPIMDFSILLNKKIWILWYGKEWKSTLNFLLRHDIEPSNITILDWMNQFTNMRKLSKKSEWFWPNLQICRNPLLSRDPSSSKQNFHSGSILLRPLRMKSHRINRF